MIDPDRFKIFCLNGDRRRIAEIDDYRSCKAKNLWNDVGTFTFEIWRTSKYLVDLTTPGNGFEIYDTLNNNAFLFGMIDTSTQKYDAATDTLTITGWDYCQWLNWRLAHPSPTETSPPYTIQAYDVRTGQASTMISDYINVNLLFAAGPRMEIGTACGDAHFGATVTGRARWQVLLPFIQDLAKQGSPDLGFKFDRLFEHDWWAFTYQSVDRTATAKFSVGFKNLAGGSIKVSSPEATYVYAAGSGDLTARVYHESYDPDEMAIYGRREYFHDLTSVSADAELKQAADQQLADKGLTTEFALTLTDTGDLVYGQDYSLGDKVTGIFIGDEAIPVVGLANGQVQEKIISVDLSIDGSDIRITPTMGSPETKDVLKIFREIRRLRTQLRGRQNN